MDKLFDDKSVTAAYKLKMKKKELKAKIKELERFIELANELLPISLSWDRSLSTDEYELLYKYHNPYYPIDRAIKANNTVTMSRILQEYSNEYLPDNTESFNVCTIAGDNVYVNGELYSCKAIKTRMKTLSWWYKGVDTDYTICSIRAWNRTVSKDEIDALIDELKD